MSSHDKYPNGMILLEDSLHLNSKNLIQYIIKDIGDSNSILCFEKSSEKWRNILKSEINYVSFLDPKKWIFYLSNPLSIESKPYSIVIDSVNQMSTILGWEYTLKTINHLRNHKDVKNVVVVLHNDCLLYGKKMVKQLSHLSSVHISVNFIKSSTFYINTITKMPTGKITHSAEEVYYKEDVNKWISTEIKREDNKKVNTVITKPTELSSFKISVEGSAKAIKDDMILPYTELNKGSGKVLYEHDAGDDWDDEDPDEDLDI